MVRSRRRRNRVKNSIGEGLKFGPSPELRDRMPKIYVALPRYRMMSEQEVQHLKKVLDIEDWVTQLPGFHPKIDISLARLIHAYPHSGITVLTGDGDLARIRSVNLAIWKDLWDKGKRYDYYLVLDDDIEFFPEGIQTLIDDDKPVICGLYTFRSKKPEIAGIPTAKFFDGQFGKLDEPFKIRWSAGGFILLKAEVLLHMIDHYKDMRYDLPEQMEGIIQSPKETWSVWDQYLYTHDGATMRLSEDYAFCQRLMDIGYDIWADWRVKLYHWDGDTGYGLTPIEDVLNLPKEGEVKDYGIDEMYQKALGQQA